MAVVRRFVLFWLAVCYLQSAMAQAVSTMPVNDPGLDRFFLYEVKLIDEFIERFNDNRESYIRQQSVALYGTDSFITRRRLLLSLFNKKQLWNEEMPLFIKQVTGHGQYLSFTDSNWYAEVACVLAYGGRETTIPVYLHICYKDGAAEWKISGIGPSAVFTDMPTQHATSSATPAGRDQFLPTSSHGTDFVVFYQALSATGVAESYFEPAALNGHSLELIALLRQKRITFKYVKEIKYHFFTIPGWYFSVSRFKRKESNSGWLISTLKPMSDPEKLMYPEKFFGNKP